MTLTPLIVLLAVNAALLIAKRSYLMRARAALTEATWVAWRAEQNAGYCRDHLKLIAMSFDHLDGTVSREQVDEGLRRMLRGERL